MIIKQVILKRFPANEHACLLSKLPLTKIGSLFFLYPYSQKVLFRVLTLEEISTIMKLQAVTFRKAQKTSTPRNFLKINIF